jgi:putative nucleotidyltransferase with HDIG domain
MNYQEALAFLRSKTHDERLIVHCEAVASKAFSIARLIPGVDAEEIRIAALLHDVGRSIEHSTHYIHTYEIVKPIFGERVALMAARHGAAKEVAEDVRFPHDLEPKSLAEKIVALADACVTGNVDLGLDARWEYLKKRYGDNKYTRAVISRARKFEKELEAIAGKKIT